MKRSCPTTISFEYTSRTSSMCTMWNSTEREKAVRSEWRTDPPFSSLQRDVNSFWAASHSSWKNWTIWFRFGQLVTCETYSLLHFTPIVSGCSRWIVWCGSAAQSVGNHSLAPYLRYPRFNWNWMFGMWHQPSLFAHHGWQSGSGLGIESPFLWLVAFGRFRGDQRLPKF